MFLTQYERGSGAGGFCAFAVSSFCTSVDGGGATSAVSSAGGGGVGVSRMYQDVLREVK